MRRRATTTTCLIGVFAAVLAMLTPAGAQAQTPYPPGLCGVLSGITDVGAFSVGETFTITLSPVCRWSPGTAVSVTVNGTAVGTRTADASGSVSVEITALNATTLSVNPLTSARCGPGNVVTGVGFSAAAGANVTETATFTLLCPGAPTPTQVAQGQLSRTGTDMLRTLAFAAGFVALGSLLLLGARRRRLGARS